MTKGLEEIKPHQRYWLLLQCQFWIFHLFIIPIALYLIAQISFIDQATTSIYATDHYNYSLEAIDLWKRGYIIDIKQVSTDNCPEAYEPLINYTWSGTQVGCYCEANVETHKLEYIMLGDCSSQLIFLGCRTIQAISPQLLKMWKGGKLICYKRAQFLTFYNSILNETTDGTVLKVCGEDTDYEVNTLPEIDCPISSISNSSISSTQTTIELNTAESLFYESQLNYPIADFKLTQYNFCPFFPQINISPNKNGNYILEIKNYSETCNGTDSRMVEFDYLNQEEFITNNSRIYDLLQALPGYPNPSPSYAYRLGFIRYPAWTHQCRTSQTHNLGQAKAHLNFAYIGQNSKLLIYVGVPCLILIAILFRGYYIIRHIFEMNSKKQFNMLLMSDHEVVEQIPNLNLIKSSTKQSLLLFMEILLISATIVVFVLDSILLLGESRWIKESFAMGCTQEHLQNIFYAYENMVDEQRFRVNRCIMFCCIIFVVQLIHFGIRVFWGDLQGKEQEQQEILSAEELLRQDIFNDKELKDSTLKIQDSSNILLNIERNDEKVYDIDNQSNEQKIIGGDQTNFNFYRDASIEIDQLESIGKKKKKKKGIKKRNLFKEEN